MSEPNSCVTGRAFDDGTAGTEEACFLGGFDDIEGCTVFDAPAWVLEFSLAENFAAGLGGEGFQADERCLADCWTRSVLWYSLHVVSINDKRAPSKGKASRRKLWLLTIYEASLSNTLGF